MAAAAAPAPGSTWTCQPTSTWRRPGAPAVMVRRIWWLIAYSIYTPLYAIWQRLSVRAEGLAERSSVRKSGRAIGVVQDVLRRCRVLEAAMLGGPYVGRARENSNISLSISDELHFMSRTCIASKSWHCADLAQHAGGSNAEHCRAADAR